MRRVFSLALSLLVLIFGSLAGLAHVHPTGHHAGAPGLHYDHDHGPASPAEPVAGSSHHHGDDAVGLDHPVLRSGPPSPRPVAALVVTIAVIEPGAGETGRIESHPRQPRDPPATPPPRPRAPPA